MKSVNREMHPYKDHAVMAQAVLDQAEAGVVLQGSRGIEHSARNVLDPINAVSQLRVTLGLRF